MRMSALAAIALVAFTSMPADARDRNVRALRIDGTLIPYTTWSSRPHQRLIVETAIRPLSDNRGFHLQVRLVNEEQLEGRHLCSVTYFLNDKGHIVAFDGIRRLVDPRAIWRATPRNESKTVAMSPGIVQQVVAADVTHFECGREADFREALNFAKEVMDKFR
jgi:hypothetical protein